MAALLPVVLLCMAAADAPAHLLRTAPARRVEAVLRYRVRAPRLRADEWVIVAAPLHETPGQRRVSTVASPPGAAVVEGGALQRPLIVVRDPVRAPRAETRARVEVRHRATLMSRALEPLPAGATPPDVRPLGDAERQAALARADPFDVEAREFQQWAASRELVRRQGESEIEFARRAFAAVKAGFSYEYRRDMDRRASAVCRAGRSDCGGLAVVFVAALRANGIPARILVGRWAQSSKEGQTLDGVAYHQTHVKAEFFADGVGWVPADPSSAILHDADGDGRRYFGRDEGDFLTLHVDPDLLIDTIHFGRQNVQWLQGAAYWVRGGGSLAGAVVEEDWQVRRIPEQSDTAGERTEGGAAPGTDRIAP